MRKTKKILIIVAVNVCVFILFELLSLCLLSIFGTNESNTKIFNAANGRDNNFIVEYDERLGYRMVDSSRSEGTFKDSIGREFSIEPSVNTFRILCVGGSTTYGVGADKTNSYPVILEKILNYKYSGCGIRFEVANFGVMGYHSWHSLIRAANEFDRYSPDMMLLMDAVNDLASSMIVDNSFSFENEKELLTILSTGSKKHENVLHGFFERSNMYRLLAVAYKKLAKRADINDISSKIEKFGYSSNTRKIIDMNTRRNISSVLVNYPFLASESFVDSNVEKLKSSSQDYYLAGKKYFSIENDRISRETGALYCDPTPVFESIKNSENVISEYYEDEIHFTKRGNYLIAKILAGCLASNISKRLEGCSSGNDEDIDMYFHPQIFFKNGFSGGNCVIPFVILDQDNIALFSDNSGFTFYSAKDSGRTGVLRLLVEKDVEPTPMKYNDFNAYIYSRVSSVKDKVEIKHNEKTIFRFVGLENRWTDVGSKYGVALPKMKTGDILTLNLSGNSQIWQSKSGAIVYCDDQFPGY